MDIAKTFEQFGFSPNESKVIYAIGLRRQGKPTEIARDAGLSYSKIYEILNKLEEKGVIVASQSKPKIYELCDIEKSLKTVVNQKQEHLNQLDNLIGSDELQTFFKRINSTEQALGVWEYPGKNFNDTEIKSTYKFAKKEIWMLGDLKIASTVLLGICQKRIKEGVTVLSIATDTPKARERAKIVREIGVQIKFVPPEVLDNFQGAVFDEEVAHFIVSDPPKRIVTNYPELTLFLSNFFKYWFKHGKD